MKKHLRKVYSGLALAVAFAGAGYLTLKAPQWHDSYLRNKVGSQVVMLTNEENNSGGTGFAIRTPNNQVLTLTNAHVCALQNSKGEVFAGVSESRRIPLHVKEISKTSDLCLLEGIARMDGLSLASSVEKGDELDLVGHPHLMPLTLSKGSLIGYANVIVGLSEGECEKEEGMMKTVIGFWGPICTEQFVAGLTNVPSLPGNSGSPMVNWKGDVIGVLFAGDDEAHWGIIVKLSDVQEFLKDY